MSISKFSAARLFSRVLLLCAASTVALSSVDANDAQNWPDRLNPKVVGINNLAPLFRERLYRLSRGEK